MRRAVPALLILLLLTAPGGGSGAWWRLPDRLHPGKPFNLAERPGWLTRHKLARIEHDPSACRAVLQEAGWDVRALPDRETGPGCGLRDAVLIRRTGTRVNTPFSLSCRAALSVALWERHVVQPAAHELFRQPVVGLHHLGSYACRNLYGREGAARSRHATADALDVAGFTLADGTRISVSGGWQAPGAPSAFLKRVHGGACRVFDGALGPAYNEAHADHLHLERGGYRVCR